MNYRAEDIKEILGTSDLIDLEPSTIMEVSIDTRTVITPSHTLFFALPGAMKDGHDFIKEAHMKGVRNFVVKEGGSKHQYTDSNFFEVEDVLSALQTLAAYHRSSFPGLQKLAITGSNGKTIIKEWLYQMLFDEFHIVKSPKSYNSQIGMALSLLAIEKSHNLGIFEAGISQKGEMSKHLNMLAPNVGLITNIGGAHDEGFESRREKLEEKMILFEDVGTIIYHHDDTNIANYVRERFPHKTNFAWGTTKECHLQVLKDEIEGSTRIIHFYYNGERAEVKLRFSDSASFENCMHCVAAMCFLGLSIDEIKKRIGRISGLHMRMEMTAGLNQSVIVNDAYSADLDALQIALEFVKQQAGDREKLAILSAFEQSGKEEKVVFKKIVDQLSKYGFSDLYYISESRFEPGNSDLNIHFYTNKENLLEEIPSIDLHQKVVLVKGARQYELEDISDRLSEKSHSSELHINLNALENNLRVYKQCLRQETELIAVVKASAYGSGSSEIARVLQRNNVNYLAVAFVDEGIALRKEGVTSNIMVFNPDLTSLPDIIRYDLEPEVYDFAQLKRILEYSRHSQMLVHIHLKLDTGMHRLGFLEGDMVELGQMLCSAEYVKVDTLFSHLASSEDIADDAYTRMQFKAFEKMAGYISETIGYFPKRHILNSGGISRFSDQQYDFVRLGIGMYGFDNNPEVKKNLHKVHGLYASLIQVKQMESGASIGYNRKTILQKKTKVGIVNIGYADGLMRNVGNGNYSFIIQGKEAPILGNVCMDLTIVDLSNIEDAKVGERVTIFDEDHPLEKLAAVAGTIPYEILSRISSRVKRKFVRE